MYAILSTKRYQKSYRKLIRSGKFAAKEADDAIDTLAAGKKLPSIYRDHALVGEMAGYRECHIRGDVLLIYRIENDQMILVLVDIGTHSELFS